MNQLSWLLYWGGVLGNLGPLLVIIGTFCFGVSGICFFLSFVYSDSNTREEDLKVRKACRGWMALLLPVSLMLWFTAALCPSSDTVYAIAASQVGEQALKTPLAAKAERAIDAWLDRQITPKASQ